MSPATCHALNSGTKVSVDALQVFPVPRPRGSHPPFDFSKANHFPLHCVCQAVDELLARASGGPGGSGGDGQRGVSFQEFRSFLLLPVRVQALPKGFIALCRGIVGDGVRTAIQRPGRLRPCVLPAA